MQVDRLVNDTWHEPVISLEDSVESLYRIAVVEGKSTSTLRLQKLAEYCVQELEQRGLESVETEASIPGAGRNKQWDVAWRHGGKYRLGISLKSILKNLPGTVPNRIDDLMGETANVQLHSPEIVIGYIMIFDAQSDGLTSRGATWHDILHEHLSSLSGRRPPSWATGMIEDCVLVKVDFSTSPSIVSVSQSMNNFFDMLVEQVARRNPDVVSSWNG